MSVVGCAELTKPPGRFTSGFWNSVFSGSCGLAASADLSDMTAASTAGFAAGELAKAQLHSAVAVPSERANLSHNAGAGLNDRDRNNDTVGVIDLSHPDFSTDESNRHVKHPHKKRKREQYKPGVLGLVTGLPGTIHPEVQNLQEEFEPEEPNSLVFRRLQWL